MTLTPLRTIVFISLLGGLRCRAAPEIAPAAGWTERSGFDSAEATTVEPVAGEAEVAFAPDEGAIEFEEFTVDTSNTERPVNTLETTTFVTADDLPDGSNNELEDNPGVGTPSGFKRTEWLPAAVRRCSARDPAVGDCFAQAANTVVGLLQAEPGLPRARLPSVGPLRISRIELPRGNSLLPALAFNISDARQGGWDRACVTGASVSPNEHSFDIEVDFPVVSLSGSYEMDGYLAGFVPVSGHGHMDVSIYNTTFKVGMRGHQESRRGRRHMALDSLSLASSISDAHFSIHNLFGNDILSNATNGILNAYSKTISSYDIPAVDKVFADVFKILIQRFFDRVPYDYLFSDLD